MTAPAAGLAEQVALMAPGAGAADERRLTDLLIDNTGVTVAGLSTPAAAAYEGYLGTARAGVSADRRAGHGALPEVAARRALAGHALDFDDTHGPSLCHVSVVTAPALGALATHRPVSGGEFLEAYGLGVRMVDFLSPFGPALNDRGIHSTGILGALAAAAAGAWLLTRDPERAATAVNIAGSLAAGICAAFGTMAKPLQAANASHAGVRAALLAAHGFEASQDAVVGERGLLATLCGPGAPALAKWGRPCDGAVSAVGLKPYPCCLLTHASIDAALELRRRHEVGSTGEIERIDVRVHPTVVALADRRVLRSGADAKFSLRYVLLLALAKGSLAVADFEPEHAARQVGDEAAWERWVDLVHVVQDASLDRLAAAVTVRSAGGRSSTSEVGWPLGSAQNPMDRAAVERKFLDNVEPVLGGAATGRTLAGLRDIAQARDVGEQLERIAAFGAART